MNCEDNADWREIELDNKIVTLDKDFETADLNEKLKEIINSIKLAKKSLLYFRQYQRTRFLLYLSIMWLGWIISLFFKITGVNRPVVHSFILLITNIVFVILVITIFIMYKGMLYVIYNLIFVKKKLLIFILIKIFSDCNNWRLFYYTFLAMVSLWLVIRNAITYTIKLKICNNKYYWTIIAEIIFLLVVMFISLTYRSVLSIGMLCIILTQKIVLKNTQNLFFWTALSLTVFPLLPVVEPYPRIYIV